MKAKLVYVSFMTRVVVEDDATEADVINAAHKKIVDKAFDEIHENVEEVEDDIECPYEDGEEKTKSFKQYK